MEKVPEHELTTTIHLGSREVTGKIPVDRLQENLTQLNDEEREIVSKLSPHDGMLIVHRGPSKGARFLLTDIATIGRSPESEVFLDDVTVSRKHAIVSRMQDKVFHLKDLGSLNGTYINGYSTTEVQLSPGDEIQIGKFHMLFFGGNK
ncbi:MAG: FHA domain-containing protein [Candidatus Nanopelagicaceae bacterium]|nr:FHA domain-containing protein [Candidatus Nanopelagicaceae bacterium]